MRLSRGAARATATALVAGCVVLAPAAPARADGDDCETVTADTVSDPVTTPSVPFTELDVDAAQQLVRDQDAEPGQGIGVAVIDSGIASEKAGDRLPVPAGRYAVEGTQPGAPPFLQGTVVAGLIAGAPHDDPAGEPLPTGVAPGVTLYDVRVYDGPESADPATTATDSLPPSPESVLGGLRWVAANLDRGPAPIKVVNVSVQVPQDDDVDAAVADLARRGVLVVAASGDRPESTDDRTNNDFYYEGGVAPPGEDAADAISPASAEDAIAVSAVAGAGLDVSNLVLRSSAIDLAAPTEGGVSVGLNGQFCTITGVSTRWAAAEVSGLLALVWSYLGAGTDAEVVRTLVERTATGPDDADNPYTGRGVPQPVEAMTRALRSDRDGDLPTGRTDPVGEDPAAAPEPEEDVLAGTRRDAVWWGLLGGSALVVALVLRPLLARRRG